MLAFIPLHRPITGYMLPPGGTYSQRESELRTVSRQFSLRPGNMSAPNCREEAGRCTATSFHSADSISFYCSRNRVNGLHYPHFTDVETESQSSGITC